MSAEDLTRLAQQKGFFIKTADSYPNAPAGFWDYGPLGVSMKNKLISLWRRALVKRDGMVEIDGALILPKAVFEASGHLAGFTDPFVRCKSCGSVFRPDKLVEEKTKTQVPERLTDAEYDELLEKYDVRCQKCGAKLTGTKRFNMMFRVGIGANEEEAYLRPETCQNIFVDSPLLFKTQRIRLPTAFAQVGKSFRNEIAPRQSLVRLRELIQAEVEVFFNPKKADEPRYDSAAGKTLSFRLADGKEFEATVAEALANGTVPSKLVGYYLSLMQDFYVAAGLDRSGIRFRALSDKDKAFYSKVAFDLEVKTESGWLELVACNYRTDYDLKRHSEVSGTDFTVEDGGEKVLPHVFELSMGVDRSVYALMEAGMKTEGERRVMKLKPYLAPLQVGVFPLVNKDGLHEKAEEVYAALLETMDAFMDDSGSIGRRYARSDEVGVPYCVTIDYDTLKDAAVTVRDRDSTKQERVQISELQAFLSERFKLPPLNPRPRAR